MIYECFLQCVSRFFYPLNNVFGRAEVLNLMFNLSIFNFMSHAFLSIFLKNLCLTEDHKAFLFCFPRSFIALGLCIHYTRYFLYWLPWGHRW